MTVTEEIQALREGIDGLDRELLELLNRRMDYARRIGEIKARHGIDPFDPGREEAICRRLTARNRGPLSDESVRAIYREILAASRILQQPLGVAFLGPEWTYSHLAAISLFGHNARYVPHRTLIDVFDALNKNLAHIALVPVENSLEGGIAQTMDLLYERPVVIVRECYLEIAHCLAGRGGEVAAVKRIYGHPQALAQCRRWVFENLRHAEFHESASTAQAAQHAAQDPEGAAICNLQAACHHGLKILAERVEDHSGNTTRFFALGHRKNAPTGHDKTSILFAVPDKPGALYTALEPFAKWQLNMTRIESRPNRLMPWQYLFFSDFEGHRDDPQIQDLLQALSERTSFLKILGSYPRSDPMKPIRFDFEKVRFGGEN